MWPPQEHQFYNNNFFQEAKKIAEDIAKEIIELHKIDPGSINRKTKNKIVSALKKYQQLIVASGCQSGKTQFIGAVSYYLDQEFTRIIGKCFHIVLCSTPSKDLRAQTFNSFLLWNMLTPSYHSPEFGKVVSNFFTWQGDKRNKILLSKINEWRNNGDIIIFFYDEVDAGTGKNRKTQDESKLRQIFSDNNIPLCGVKSKRPYHEFGIMVTATLAHLVSTVRESDDPKNPDSSQSLRGYPLYEVYARTPGEGYVGHDDLLSRNYFKKGYRINTKSKDALRKLIHKKIDYMVKNQDYGHMVFRVSPKGKEFIEEIVGDHYLCNDIAITEINCTKNNIANFPLYMKKKPETPRIWLIKRAGERGIQFDDMENIQLWFDTLQHEAGTIQSTGRFCGYGKTYHPQLEIYCDLHAIQKNALFYKAAKGGTKELNDFIFSLNIDYDQTGTHNKKKSGRLYKRIKTHSFPDKKSADAFNNSLKNASQFFRIHKNGIHKQNLTPYLNTVSTNNERDVAAAISNHSVNSRNQPYFHNNNNAILNACFHNGNHLKPEMIPGHTKVYQLIYVDSPNFNYQNSWDSVSSYFGKYVITESLFVSEYSYDNTADWPIA
jgi:hypothetical protein